MKGHTYFSHASSGDFHRQAISVVSCRHSAGFPLSSPFIPNPNPNPYPNRLQSMSDPHPRIVNQRLTPVRLNFWINQLFAALVVTCRSFCFHRHLLGNLSPLCHAPIPCFLPDSASVGADPPSCLLCRHALPGGGSQKFQLSSLRRLFPAPHRLHG